MTDTSAPRAGDRLQYAPMALFASVMGLGGLALAWRRAHHVLGVPTGISEALVALACATYVANVVVQLARAWRDPRSHRAEFAHPASATFVPAFTIASAIVAGGIAPHAPAAARWLWAGAATLHLLLAFVLLRRWFTEQRALQEASPSWFIPVVGNLLMPVVGVPLGFTEPGWFLFSVGFVFWLILAPVMTHRLFFADPLPERALPSLFILLAPPAVGGLAMLALNDGVPTMYSHVMYGFGIFIALLTASMLGRILRTHVAIGWWALTFPCAAFANLSLAYAAFLDTPASRALAVVALTFATGLVVLVAVRTTIALRRGYLIAPPVVGPRATTTAVGGAS